jgi:hypothetical protein
MTRVSTGFMLFRRRHRFCSFNIQITTPTCLLSENFRYAFSRLKVWQLTDIVLAEETLAEFGWTLDVTIDSPG